MPQAAVTGRGIFTVSSLSRMTSVTSRPTITVDFLRLPPVITAPTVISAPVPAVLGMLIMGRVLSGTGRNFSRSLRTGTDRSLDAAAIILQESITEPPPRPIMQSASNSTAALRPSSMMRQSGSESILSNTVNSTPAFESESQTLPAYPRRLMLASVTSSALRKPRLAQTAPASALLPKPLMTSGFGIGTVLMTFPGSGLIDFLMM